MTAPMRYEGMQGPAELKAYAQRVGINLRDVAKILSVREQTVFQWTSGQARPRTPKQYAIQTLAGIPVEAWLTDEEKGEIRHLRAEINTLREAQQVPPRTFREEMAGRI